MALENLFEMVKADKYTQDGREAIIKAQEKETEDKVYNIGDISQKTGLQKTANGWVKPKKGKQPGAKKETPEEFIKNAKEKQQSKTEARLKEEQTKPQKAIESARQNFEEYKKENPDWQNKSEEEIYRELGKKAREAESKPAAPVKRNEAEKVKHSDGTESYRIKGTQFYFNTPEEAESALLTESRYGKTYATASKDPEINNIQEALGFKLDMHGSGKSMDKFMKKIGENEYAANVWAFGTDSKGTMINPLDETDKPNSVIKKENGEWKLHYTGSDGRKVIVSATGREHPTSDAAPRVLTGDCRIRIRKEKPALTGDTRIKVRK